MSFILNLAVEDLERTLEFYREVLGLPVERFAPAVGHPEVLILRRGETTLLFREIEVVEALHPALFQNLHRHPLGVGLSLEFSLPDLCGASHNLDRRGLHTLYELDDAEFGRAELWLHDPDGYLVVLCREPVCDASP